MTVSALTDPFVRAAYRLCGEDAPFPAFDSWRIEPRERAAQELHWFVDTLSTLHVPPEEKPVKIPALTTKQLGAVLRNNREAHALSGVVKVGDALTELHRRADRGNHEAAYILWSLRIPKR